MNESTYCKSGKMDVYGRKNVEIVREEVPNYSGRILLAGIILAAIVLIVLRLIVVYNVKIIL